MAISSRFHSLLVNRRHREFKGTYPKSQNPYGCGISNRINIFPDFLANFLVNAICPKNL